MHIESQGSIRRETPPPTPKGDRFVVIQELSPLEAYSEGVKSGRMEMRVKCWRAIDKYVKRSHSGGHGCDELSQINGLVLACNLITKIK
jgi:hypothetical protein